MTSDNMPMSLCEIGLFHIVCGVSKGTSDNYHEIGENNVLGQNILTYINFGGSWEGYKVHLTFFCLLFIKTGKVQEHDPY